MSRGEFASWDAFVAQAESGSIYSTTNYLEALCSAAGGTFRIAVIESSTGIVGGVALYDVSTRWGRICRPRLLLQYTSPVIDCGSSQYPSSQTSLLVNVQTLLADFLADQDYASIVLKCLPPITDIRAMLAHGWRATPTYTYIMWLDDLEARWQRVDRNIRRLIRKAGEKNLTISDDTDFDRFFEMHEATHHRKGAPIYMPKPEFHHFFSTLHKKGLAKLFHARESSGRSVAAQLVLLGQHPITHTVSACSDAQSNFQGSNAFLRWSVFEELAGMGYAGNDLTDASLNSVTRFKSQFGGALSLCFALESRESMIFRIGNAAESLARQILRRA